MIVDYQIGKGGITDNSVDDIINHLKSGHRLKIRFLKSFLESNTRFEASENIISRIPFNVEKQLVGNILKISLKQKI